MGIGLELAGAGMACAAVACARRRLRRPATVRFLIEPYRNDRADPERVAATFVALHGLVGRRGMLALETHLDRRPDGAPIAWFALECPAGLERHVRAALRRSYPSVRLRAAPAPDAGELRAVRLARRLPPRAGEEPPGGPHGVEPLLAAMAAAGPPVTVRLALRPAPALLELVLSTPERAAGPLWWAAPVVLARDRRAARAIASVLAGGAPRLRPRAVGRRRRLRPPRSPRFLHRAWELARLWALPDPEFAAVPCMRGAVPIAPAPPGITRRRGEGLLRDEHGEVTIDEPLRRQHVAVVGAVEQGKTSFLVASVREDLRRPDCAVIVLDPKGDAADAVLSIVPPSRTCTVLDMAAPTAGFNPLAVDAAPDAIADHVVAALRGLFEEGEVRGSSDRYLRNALVAALACARGATLWDVARLLEVGEGGRALRARVTEQLIAQPAYAELATFFAEELPAQLAASRATTTAKLDAPANKLARVLNSPAVKRVLLNDSLRIDIDGVIARREVLVVRGALGEIGAGNVAVLMQLLLGMVDAALGRLQDRRAAGERGAVALKIDEAPLVINAAFAQTLALKRSAGLETVACWQTDAQWEPELRGQLDALFAHRVLFATASAQDARTASSLLMSEYSDQVRPGDEQLALLASPDVRLHLPRHTALVSWTTARGRERPFVATTTPMPLDRGLIDWHLAAQRERGGRALAVPAAPLDTIAPAAAVAPPARAVAPATVRSRAGAPVTASYAELVALDRARRVRWLAGAPARGGAVLEEPDRALLEWLAAARCALSSQIHRRFGAGRSLTSTQRALKRLADRGLVGRFQLHRDDGGGVPQCCAATDAAIELLGVSGRRAPELREAQLDALRRDVHLVGWLLALEARAGAAVREVLGPGRAELVPGVRTPAELALGDGLRPRELLATGPDGVRVPVSRFAALRPHAAVELARGVSGTGGGLDLLVWLDGPGTPAALEAADHMLAGWWGSLERYRRRGTPPRLVVVCADHAQALARATLADARLTGALARIGVAPAEWRRPGREGICFAVEADLHAGSAVAWAVPPLPPGLRGGEAAGPVPVELAALPAAGDLTAAMAPWR